MDNNGGFSSELIRDNLDLFLLKELMEGDCYGYELLEKISQKTANHFVPSQSTVYSTLSKLDKNGFVISFQEEGEDNKKVFYSLTEKGRLYLEKSMADWEFNRTLVDSLISEKKVDLTSVDDTASVKAVKTKSKRGIGLAERLKDNDEAKDEKTASDATSLLETLRTELNNVEAIKNEAEAIQEKATDVMEQATERQSSEASAIAQEAAINEATDDAFEGKVFIPLASPTPTATDENKSTSLDAEAAKEEGSEIVEEKLEDIEQKKNDVIDSNAKLADVVSEDKHDKEDVIVVEEKKDDEQILNDLSQKEVETVLDDNSSRIFHDEEAVQIEVKDYTNAKWTSDSIDAKLVDDDKTESDEEFSPISRQIDFVEAADDVKTSKKNKNAKSDSQEATIIPIQEAEDVPFNDDDDDNELEVEEAEEEAVATVSHDEAVKLPSGYSEYLGAEETVETKRPSVSLNDILSYSDTYGVVQKEQLFDAASKAKEESDGTYDELDNVSYSWIQSEMRKRGFTVRPYMHDTATGYYNGGNFIFGNRLSFHTGVLLYAVMLLEVFLSYFVLDSKIGGLGFLPYLYTVLALMIVPVYLALRYCISPQKRRRAKFNLKISLAFSALLYINLSIICCIIGFFGFNADTENIKSMILPIFYPLAFLLNLFIYPLIYSGLYKTRRYHLE